VDDTDSPFLLRHSMLKRFSWLPVLLPASAVIDHALFTKHALESLAVWQVQMAEVADTDATSHDCIVTV